MTALLTSWITRPTLDANVATISLPVVVLTIASRLSPTSFSLGARHFLVHHRLSPINSLTHSVPIRAIFAISAGSPIAGV